MYLIYNKLVGVFVRRDVLNAPLRPLLFREHFSHHGYGSPGAQFYSVLNWTGFLHSRRCQLPNCIHKCNGYKALVPSAEHSSVCSSSQLRESVKCDADVCHSRLSEFPRCNAISLVACIYQWKSRSTRETALIAIHFTSRGWKSEVLKYSSRWRFCSWELWLFFCSPFRPGIFMHLHLTW